MQMIRARSLAEALELKADHPEAELIHGGTDVMVDLNFGRADPPMIIDISSVDALAEWSQESGHIRLGAGVTYRRIIDELATALPGLALAARTVGSPQIRNRGTVGGNLGAASPAGDSHPPLMATRGVVEVESKARGARRIMIDAFYAGPKRSTLAEDELIVAVEIPVAAGPQQFSKIGTRNAMVIAACSFAVSLDLAQRSVGTGIGSAGPTPLRARDAEAFLSAVLDEVSWDLGGLTPSALSEFGALVAAAASPIDDVRATADYRRHALRVMATRTATWAAGGMARAA